MTSGIFYPSMMSCVFVHESCSPLGRSLCHGVKNLYIAADFYSKMCIYRIQLPTDITQHKQLDFRKDQLNTERSRKVRLLPHTTLNNNGI
jgi:hypothetical protein